MRIGHNTAHGWITDLEVEGTEEELRRIALDILDAIEEGQKGFTINADGKRAAVEIICHAD